jgi:LacI family transcriptional regulator
MAAQRAHTKMSDVADLAGVSVGTVSNFFNRPEKVSEERRRRVAAAVEELGFVPNGLARAFARGHRMVVGLVILDFNNPFFSEAARGLGDRLTAEGIMLTVSSSDEDPDRETACIKLLEEHSVAGLVITPSSPSLRPLERITERGTPAVLLGRRQPVEGGWCAVTGDDSLGGAIIGRHLLEVGHRRVGYMSGRGTTRLLDARHEGVRTSIEAAGASFTEILTSNMTVAGGERGTSEFLQLTDRPTALVCANDLLALGALRVLQERGVRVPEDVALVGYDDVDFARSLGVPLTTVRQDKYALGYRAGDLLLKEIGERDTHEHSEILLPPELIVRASTDGAGR